MVRRLPPPEWGAEVPEDVDRVGSDVVDAAYRVHRALGPGLLERVYQRCLVHALRARGLDVQEEVWIPVRYDGLEFERGLRVDLVVEQAVAVEVKAVESVHPVHEAQVLTYLRLGGFPLGYLINFHSARAASGIKRYALTR